MVIDSEIKYFNKIKKLSSDKIKLLCDCQDLLNDLHDVQNGFSSLSIDYLFDDYLEMKRQSYLIKIMSCNICDGKGWVEYVDGCHTHGDDCWKCFGSGEIKND